MKRVAINYEFFASKMEMRVWEIRAELENIKKNMRLLNSETTKLDHLPTIVQSCHNRLDTLVLETMLQHHPK